MAQFQQTAIPQHQQMLEPIAEDGTATREWSTESNNTMVVPTPPTDNGTYVLKATVVDGVVTTEWVLEA